MVSPFSSISFLYGLLHFLEDVPFLFKPMKATIGFLTSCDFGVCSITSMTGLLKVCLVRELASVSNFDPNCCGVDKSPGEP